ncbi:MAG: hypothetical protein DSM107014_08050 [Gomphosphaeria aponina SAG 52.96 = DSM 107014]|uniref:Uncharacterized protein n=1 Tax=Gomphosphaeria aponina SAG 52.96 = DSM 107014 TaxID=1521640 RepID=A0A941GWH2_9CHRO|nr:hypothetical protein [Gomphosphaeria aponina SAG 52.96 = DSM 107014]
MSNFQPELQKQVENLYKLTIYFRWIVVVCSWLTLGSFGIWGLQEEFSLWHEYFTFAAVRYGLAYNLLPSFSLAFCIGITVAVLMRQTINFFRGGISAKERKSLEKQVQKIMATGPSHPLWKWITDN